LLLKAASRVMRPLVRLMIRGGVSFPVLADALRALFVDVAVNELLPDSRARTDSRISLLTGVHRKEIRRLRALPVDVGKDVPAVVTLGSQIVARWLGAPAFSDADGLPLALLRVDPGRTGGPGSFDALVESVTTDVRPRAVLDDLLSHGIVWVGPDDRVRLNTDAFIPRPGGEEQLFYFARNLSDHAAAAVGNITAAGLPRFLDRSVHYDRLTAAQAGQLEAFAREAAIRVLLEVNRRALELTELMLDEAETAQRRVNFGVYVFDDEDRAATDGAP
jgi:hypothetical protein